MKKLIVLVTIMMSLSLVTLKCGNAQQTENPGSNPKIQVAILLDASNSMDGLISQAKSRLWNIVNTLTTLRFNGKPPVIEIALYMYGNDGLRLEDNYIKQIAPFTRDLDLISEKLFAVRTNGGSEYCGAVIEHAVKKLDWDREKNSMRLIYIAGNEPFNQGGVSFKEAISDAVNKDIYVNTIHCGNYGTGVEGFWKDGAERGKGKYFCINSNARVIYVVTPYDDELNRCNERLNRTYIYYGSKGYSSYENQSVQDENAQSVSGSYMAERAVSKSKSVYINDSWDLVDKLQADTTYYKKVDKKTLPKEYQNMSAAQLKAEIDKKTAERNAIQKEIAVLSKRRQDYIDKQAKSSATSEDDFGKAINTSILELANSKGYKNE